MFLPDRMTDLTIHLAEGGKMQEALTLARKLLDRFTQDAERSDAYATWRFDRMIERLTPALATYGDLPALTLLCEALLSSLGEQAYIDDAEHDDSYIWRPAIEDHQQNAPKGFRALKNSLVSALRDVAEQQIREGKATPSQVVEVLEQFRAPIFLRLAMHLLHIFPDQARETVTRYLTTHEYFDKLCYHHEYVLLLKIGFKLLTPNEQQIVLDWIAPTPDWALAAPREDQTDKADKDQAAEDNLDYWRLERLTPFARDLPPTWNARYDELVLRYGVPEHPDFVMYFTAGWVENTAGAVTVEQMRAMTISQLLEYLESWVPSESWRGPSREGVGQLLAEVISTDPEPFAQSADRFADLHPTYLAAMFQGFERALTRKAAFDWGTILRLAQRCLGQAAPMAPSEQDIPRSTVSAELKAGGINAEDAPNNVDEAHPGRNESAVGSALAWVRNTIAQLLEHALTLHPVPIAPELQGIVWAVVHSLASDADPTPEDERRLSGNNMDPASLSINSVRGVALHAVVLYAVWASTLTAAASVGGAMPEALEVLEEHLDAEKDPSPAIRTVYGRRFPQLVQVDPIWTADHVAAIFPSGEEQRHMWEAAWDTYVLYNLPTQRTWTLLHGEYARALERLGAPTEGRKHAAEADVRLVEHLIELAWAGEIAIGEPSTLLERAYIRADDELLGQVTSHVGLRVVNTKEELPSAIRQRLQDLWQWRMASMLEDNAAEHQQELAAFGWWYGSGQFETAWALKQLEKVLTLTRGRIDGVHLVLERLAETPHETLSEALGCLIRLVNGDRFEDYADVLEPQIGQLLATIQTQGDTESRTRTIRLINQLVARGYMSYRAYLPPATGSSSSGATD